MAEVTDSEPVFEAVAEQFLEGYGAQVRGHVRYEVIRSRLQPFLEDVHHVLDYGGGDGRDSLWLAAQGIDVDYWDNTPKMVKKATRAVGTAEVAGRIRICQLDPAEVSTPRYDLLLLHGVIQYLKPQESNALMQRLFKVVKAGGLLSLATKNIELVEAGEKEAPGIKAYGNNVDRTCRAYSADFLNGWLTGLGFGNFSVRGVRCLRDDDDRPISNVPMTELKKIVEAEVQASSKEESIKNGHMLHVLATKP